MLRRLLHMLQSDGVPVLRIRGHLHGFARGHGGLVLLLAAPLAARPGRLGENKTPGLEN